MASRALDLLKKFGGEMFPSLVSDLLTVGVFGQKGKILTQEQAQGALKILAPNIFGIGEKDEAAVQAALAALRDEGDQRISKIARWLLHRTNRDQTRFILALSHCDESDRKNILNMYAELPDENEMCIVARSTRMMKDCAGPTGPCSPGNQQTVSAINGIITPVHDKIVEFDDKAAELGKKIRRRPYGRIGKIFLG